MQTTANVTTVSHVIQLARVQDRFRILNNFGDQEQTAHTEEIETLSRRAQWIHRAVSLCTVSALLICIVIAALFIGSQVGVDPSRAISLQFILAMLALITGLLCFLREIYLATGPMEMRVKQHARSANSHPHQEQQNLGLPLRSITVAARAERGT